MKSLRVIPVVLLLVTGTVAPPAGAQDLARAVEGSYPTNLSMITDAANAAVNEMFISFRAPEGITLLVEAEVDHEARWFIENLILARLTDAGYSAYLKAGGGSGPGPVPETGQAEAAPQALNMADAVRAQQEQAEAQAKGDPGATTASQGAEAPPETPVRQRPRPGGPGEVGPAVGSPAEADLPEVEPAEFVFRFRVAECALTYPRSYRKSPLGSRIVQRLASVSLYATLVQGSREDVLWVGSGDAERLDHVPAGKLPLLEGKTFPFSKPVLNARGMGAYVEPALVTGIVAGLIYLFYTNQN